jgi:hypothetical protein
LSGKCCTAHNAAGHEIQGYELRISAKQYQRASCAGLTRASIDLHKSFPKRMDCRVKPGNDEDLCNERFRSAFWGFQRGYSLFNRADALVEMADSRTHDDHHGGCVVAMFTDDAFDPLQAVAQVNNPILDFPQDV